MRQFPEYMGFPPGVFFSRGAVSRLGEQGKALGPRGLLLHGRSMRRSGAVERVLAGAESRHVQEVVSETLESGSTAHNPKRVTEEDVRWFLERLFSH